MSGIVRTIEPSLWGKSVTTAAGIQITFAPPVDDDGSAGVREPRRPKPPVPAAAAAVEPDTAEVVVLRPA